MKEIFQKVLPSLFLFLLVAQVAMADKITEEKAYDIASRFMNGNEVGVRKAKAGDAKLHLVKSSKGYYAFNRGVASGFVIVAADDEAVNTVLGYADEGTLPSVDKMPENLKWWLSEYDRQIAYSATHHSVSKASNIEKYDAIAPLMKSLWGQDDPYNMYCPSVNDEQCPSGCVATAAAQIMYYHKWPKQGTGTYSYTTRVGNKVTTLSADFGNTYYNWDAMTDTYNSNSSEESRVAVGLLMFHVGVASKMEYAVDGSGTYDIVAAQGLIRNLGYDKSMQFVYRDYYGLAEWMNILYKELSAGRPFLYGGADASNAGHAFVGDGYRDGYFHINWGWNGLSNGYFLISALDPSQQGTGGGGAGYNYQQDAIIGIRPAESGSQYKGVIYGDNFTTMSSSTNIGKDVVFNGPFYNMSLISVSAYFGIKIVDEAGKETIIASNSPYSMNVSSGATYYSVNTSSFPSTNGTYKVYPIFRLSDSYDWDLIHIKKPLGNSYLLATVNNGAVSFSDPQIATGTLSADTLIYKGKIYAGNQFSLSTKLSYTGNEYNSYVHVVFKNPSEGLNYQIATNRTTVNLIDGMTMNFSFQPIAPTKAGDYQMVLQDDLGNELCTPVNITVNSVPTGSLNMNVFKRLKIENADNVSADDIHITTQLSCLSGFYSNVLLGYVFDSETGNSLEYFTEPIVIGAGDRLDIDLHKALTSVEEGKKYILSLAYVPSSSQNVSLLSESVKGYNQAEFTVKSLVSGVNAITTNVDSDIRIYSATGILVDQQHGTKPSLDNLPKGLYIVKQGNTSKQVLKR